MHAYRFVRTKCHFAQSKPHSIHEKHRMVHLESKKRKFVENRKRWGKELQNVDFTFQQNAEFLLNCIQDGLR